MEFGFSSTLADAMLRPTDMPPYNSAKETYGGAMSKSERPPRPPGRSMSMIEMNEISDAIEFSEAVGNFVETKGLNGAQAQGCVSNGGGYMFQDLDGSETDDLFFVDTDDTDDNEEGSNTKSFSGGFLGVGSVPTLPPAPPVNTNSYEDTEVSSTKVKPKSFRRSKSMASISSKLKKHLFSSSQTDLKNIPTISEEVVTRNDVPSAEPVPETLPSKEMHECNAVVRDEDANGDPVKIERRSSMLRSSLKRCSSIDTMDSSSSSVSTSMKRNVSFASLEIRSYPVTLGDQPSVNGPAVSLSWKHDNEETYDVDEYESYRCPTSGKIPRRQSRQEFHMPGHVREYLLVRNAGFSRGDIRQAIAEAKKVNKQRESTNKMVGMGLMPVEEALEKAGRSVKKIGKIRQMSRSN